MPVVAITAYKKNGTPIGIVPEDEFNESYGSILEILNGPNSERLAEIMAERFRRAVYEYGANPEDIKDLREKSGLIC